MADNKKSPPPKPAASFTPIILIGFLALAVLPFVSALTTSETLAMGAARLVEFFKTIATIVSMIALVVIVYAFMRLYELSRAETEQIGLVLNWQTERKQKNVRWKRVERYMTSLNSSDWKIAILEADNILDEIVERMGYKGRNLGERMKTIEASDFPYLDEAWQVHKLRNQIAHQGTEYELTRSDAEQAINIYHRIFKELGYL